VNHLVKAEKEKQKNITMKHINQNKMTREERIFNSNIMFKQETIEEACVKYAEENAIDENISYHNLYAPLEYAFRNGAKWQQEKMYSEEDMMFAYEQGARLAMISQSDLARNKGEFPNPKQWFEQFKKK